MDQIIKSIHQTSPDRLTLTLADGTEIKSTLGVITQLYLFPGKLLSEEDTENLKEESCRALSREKALEYVSRRQMSSVELKKKLMEKGEDEDTADYCVQWLTENKFLDDERYAGAVARHYFAKGYGQGRIRAELSRRGVAREYWDEAIEQLPEDNNSIDKYIRTRLSDPEDKKQRQKVTNALYRRGFSWDEIKSAMNRYEDECL